jgi:hypothetical protein
MTTREQIEKSDLHAMARFYLQHQGQKGTVAQIDALVMRLPAENIARMALARGYKRDIK